MMPKPEPPPRQRDLDTAPVDWDAVINQRVANMKDFVMVVLGEALCETLKIERGAYADALRERDNKIVKLEAEIAKQAVHIAKLEVRVIKNEIDNDRDKEIIELPPLPKQEQIN
jgi:hypothetical protein